MPHQAFDLDYWEKRFPLPSGPPPKGNLIKDEVPEVRTKPTHWRRAVPPDMSKLSGEYITSPIHIVRVEQIRRQCNVGALHKGFETHVVALGKGAPSSREVTKFGGLPYWHKNRPWPVSKAGHPMKFLAQVLLSDSRKIIPQKLQDVVVIFVDKCLDLGKSINPMRDQISVYGVPISEETLVQPEDIPRGCFSPNEWFGVIHKTVDYPDWIPDFDKYRRSHLLNLWAGTKIGGFPNLEQGGAGKVGKYICSLGSISPALDTDFPYVNISAPLQQEEDGRIIFGDMGSLHLFQSKRNEISWLLGST